MAGITLTERETEVLFLHYIGKCHVSGQRPEPKTLITVRNSNPSSNTYQTAFHKGCNKPVL